MTKILVQVETEDDVSEKDLFDVVKIAIDYSADRGELVMPDSNCVFPEVTLVSNK